MTRQRAWIITFLIGLFLVFTVIVPAAVVTSKKKHNFDNKDAYPLDVMLKAVQGSEVLVTITNNGKHDINLFARGTILDPNPVLNKINIVSANGTVPRFIGVHPEISKQNLSAHSFHALPPKWTADFSLDVAYLYDVSAGGEFEVTSLGSIPFSEKDSTLLSGTAVFSSNTVKMNIPKGFKSSLERTVLQADCTGSRYSNTVDANAMCALISTVAGHAAVNGDPETFFRYFRTYDMGMRQLVSKRFFAVANECAGKTKFSTTYCTDQLKLCQSDYIAVTLGTRITNCDIFWSFPLITNQCHGYDRATTVIHEITHVDGLFDPSTVDFADNYGWPKLTYLTPDQAVTNADNYQYFANAVSVGSGC